MQEQSYIDFLYDNDYRDLIDASTRQKYLNVLHDQCLPALQTCRRSNTNADCVNADSVCYQGIEGPLTEEADFDVYDVRSGSSDPNPPKTYNQYLADPAVVAAIGAKSTYTECANAAGNKFSRTGDCTLLPSFLSFLLTHSLTHTHPSGPFKNLKLRSLTPPRSNAQFHPRPLRRRNRRRKNHHRTSPPPISPFPISPFPPPSSPQPN